MNHLIICKRKKKHIYWINAIDVYIYSYFTHKLRAKLSQKVSTDQTFNSPYKTPPTFL